MKYIVLLSDGMAGKSLEELGNKTTMEAAKTPNMDRLSKDAYMGLAHMVPRGMAPGSDTANLAVMGYDPKKYYTGRSPLEALSIGVDMKATDVSLRMNLVTLSDEENYEDKKIIDHSAGEITTEEAKVLVEDLAKALHREGYHFYSGTAYRHLVIMENKEVVELTPPHDILEKHIKEYLPKDEILRELMIKSYDILKEHPINKKRRDRGEREANSIWFWGAGTRPALDDFYKKTGKKGMMISAVDLLKGIAVGTGMDIAKVPGMTGGLHTNYEGKANAAVKALTKEDYDFVYIHVEAPDEMGHQGLVKEKVEAIENIDSRVLGVLCDKLDKENTEYRIMVLPDHPTPIEDRTHTNDAVPFMIYDSTKKRNKKAGFSEKDAEETGIFIEDGYKLLDTLLK